MVQGFCRSPSRCAVNRPRIAPADHKNTNREARTWKREPGSETSFSSIEALFLMASAVAPEPSAPRDLDERMSLRRDTGPRHGRAVRRRASDSVLMVSASPRWTGPVNAASGPMSNAFCAIVEAADLAGAARRSTPAAPRRTTAASIAAITALLAITAPAWWDANPSRGSSERPTPAELTNCSAHSTAAASPLTPYVAPLSAANHGAGRRWSGSGCRTPQRHSAPRNRFRNWGPFAPDVWRATPVLMPLSSSSSAGRVMASPSTRRSGSDPPAQGRLGCSPGLVRRNPSDRGR